MITINKAVNLVRRLDLLSYVNVGIRVSFFLQVGFGITVFVSLTSRIRRTFNKILLFWSEEDLI